MEDTATATIDPPAAQAPDAAPPATEPTSFHAPNPFATDDSLLSHEPPQTPAQDPPATQQQAPEATDDEDDDPPPAKPEDGSLTPEKAAYIAEQKKSRKILREERDAERARLAELTTKQTEWQQARELAEQRAKDLEAKLAERDDLYRQQAVPKYDPATDPEITKITSQLRESFNDVAAELDPTSRAALTENWWNEIDSYDKAREAMSLKAYKEELADRYPGEDTESIYRLIRESAPKIKQGAALRTEREATHAQRIAQGYEQRRQKATEYVTKFGEWTDAQIAENPTDPQAIISRVARDNPKVKEQIKALGPKFANLLAGNPPLPPNAPAEALIAHRQAERDLEAMRASAPMLHFERPILQQIIAQQQQELEQLRGRVGAVTEAKRPGATFQPEAEPKQEAVSGWGAPNPHI